MPLFHNFKFYGSNWFCLQNSLLLFCKRYMSESYYDILKVPETCSSKDVRDAFINLSKKNHPDKHLNDPTMHERFIKINEAYTVLINPLSRRAYDINLHHKKKLGAPGTEIFKQPPQRTHPKNSSAMKNESIKPNFSSYARGDPFTFHYQTSKEQKQQHQEYYYGIKGVKKISNSRIAVVVLLFTLLAVIIQLITIRNSVIRSRERLMEENRKNSLLHAMAREKLTLYGTEYQINLLKKSLKGAFDSDIEEEKSELKKRDIKNGSTIDHSSHPPVLSSSSKKDQAHVEVCEKCKKCNHL